MKLVITCEHGGNEIPVKYSSYFQHQNAVLESHRGFDIGALDTFESLKNLADFSKHSNTSRLLIELNRSLHHKNLFSEFSKSISKAEKQNIINNYYNVYRNEVETYISKTTAKKEQILHISVHSFTPILNGLKRNADIGLLFDSRKPKEKVICKKIKDAILIENKNLKVRYNYPYLGKADGFTTYLRKQFKENYIGIEIEINQKFSNQNQMDNSIKQILFRVIQNIAK